LKIKIIGCLNFYVIWFLSVLYTSHKSVGLMPLIALVLLQLYCLANSQFPFKKLLLLLIVALIGWLFDSILNKFAIIHFYGLSFLSLAPIWLLLLWVAFVCVFNQFFYAQLHKTWVWSLFGFLLFPLNYYAGCQLGAAIWLKPWLATLLYAIFGAIIFFIMRLIINFNRIVMGF